MEKNCSTIPKFAKTELKCCFAQKICVVACFLNPLIESLIDVCQFGYHQQITIFGTRQYRSFLEKTEVYVSIKSNFRTPSTLNMLACNCFLVQNVILWSLLLKAEHLFL